MKPAVLTWLACLALPAAAFAAVASTSRPGVPPPKCSSAPRHARAVTFPGGDGSAKDAVKPGPDFKEPGKYSKVSKTHGRVSACGATLRVDESPK